MTLIIIKRLLMALVFSGLLVYVTMLVFVYLKQASIIFNSEPLPADFQFQYPSDINFDEITIPVDGASLNALHFKQPNPKGVLLFLHGNGGNLSIWATTPQYWAKPNYDLFIFDYRGYGKSTGTVSSEQQLHDDVRAAWDYIAPKFQSQGLEAVIYGRSLGSAVAVHLATQVEHDLLVLVSPFANMTDMAAVRYPWLPSAILKYPLASDQKMKDVKAPVLFMHGANDSLIPVSHSERLQANTIQPSELVVVEGAGHEDIHDFDSYLEYLTNELIAL